MPPRGGAAPRRPPAPAAGSTAFRDVLAEMERSSLNFSRHAQKRIEQRNLQMDGGRVERLEAAVERATEKGSRDSLILLDELALVVSVRSSCGATDRPAAIRSSATSRLRELAELLAPANAART